MYHFAIWYIHVHVILHIKLHVNLRCVLIVYYMYTLHYIGHYNVKFVQHYDVMSVHVRKYNDNAFEKKYYHSNHGNYHNLFYCGSVPLTIKGEQYESTITKNIATPAGNFFNCKM